MSFQLPDPTVPTNGQALDATPLLANLVAIEQAIDDFDGSQIHAKSIVEAALADAVNPRLRDSEIIDNFVHTGCIWSSVSGLSGTMTGGTIYVNGYRTTVASIGSNTFTALKDIYIDIDYLGNVTYNETTNGGTPPALTANAIRVAKVVTASSSISSVTQSGYDSNGIRIYSGQSAHLGLANSVQSLSNSGTAGGTLYYINLGSIKLLWGLSGNQTTGSTPLSYTFTLPPGFFSTVSMVQATAANPTGNANQFPTVTSQNTTTITVYLTSPSGAATAGIELLVIGT